MREILFRGKRIDGKGWVEGSLISTTGEGKRPLIHVSPNEGEVIVDPETVGQIVCGDLYEGDIAELWHSDQVSWDEDGEDIIDNPTICLLRWGGESYPAFEFYSKRKSPHNKKGWFWDSITEEFNSFSDDEMQYKIIGNIHDTPELLEVTQ